MKNGVLLKQAIELLQGVNSDETETIEVENTIYDDGSIGFSINVTFPSKDVEEEKYYD